MSANTEVRQFLVFPSLGMRGLRDTDEEIPVAIIVDPQYTRLGEGSMDINFSLPHIASL